MNGKKENRLGRLFGEGNARFVSEDASDEIDQHASDEKDQNIRNQVDKPTPENTP